MRTQECATWQIRFFFGPRETRQKAERNHARARARARGGRGVYPYPDSVFLISVVMRAEKGWALDNATRAVSVGLWENLKMWGLRPLDTT